MNNEERILSLLEKHDAQFDRINATLEKHGEMLEKHDAQFDRINATLDKHSEMLDKHSEMLDKHSDMLAQLGHEIVKINVTLENQIVPQIQALAEGQSVILEKLDALAPKSRVETLEEEVAFLKEVIRMHTAQINELKKAQ